MEAIKIYLIDDHKLFVEGICALFAEEPGIEVLGCSLSPGEFLRKANEIHADVFLVDINMPEISGVEVTQQLKQIKVAPKILALTMYDDLQHAETMLQTGASGYILKTANLKELIRAIRVVAGGGIYLSEDMQHVLFHGTNRPSGKEGSAQEPEKLLTPREVEILALIARELSTEQIANKLFISERTVETHRKNLLVKTNARSVVGLIKFAVRNKIVSFEKD
jgi:DNA-binding NarL/FixJ family response regulator